MKRSSSPGRNDIRAASCGARSHLHVKVPPDSEEEAVPRGHVVGVQPGLVDGRPDVLEAVGDGESKLEGGARPGLLHVISTDAHAVEIGHVRRREPDDVGHDPVHGRLRRIDVRVPDLRFGTQSFQDPDLSD